MPYQIGWLSVTIAAYVLHSFAAILDKFLLTQRIQRPSTYVFWVGVLGLGVFVLAPFGFFVPANSVIINAFVSGVAFTFALFFFYIAMQSGEASRVTPIIGALSPIFVFLLSRGILGETLSSGELAAFVILVTGSVLMSITRKIDGTSVNHHDLKIFGLAILASFLFGVTYVFEKAVFNETAFISGFIWTRIGGFFGVLPFLVFSATRSSIFEAPRLADRVTMGAFFANKAAGALGFFLLSFAISIAPSVSLVNALQGIEYALIFLLALFLSKVRPAILEEEVTTRIVLEKTFAILLIAGGLVLLSFSQ
ncbi:MAG: EamA family transporter [Candidatus Sungiibacteriota bacterium]